MMTIVHDGNTEGTHDLQKGMCSGYRFRLAQQENRLGVYYPREIKEIPDHGCYENLSKAVAPYGIIPEDIPSPFNLNQHMKIDGVTGKMKHTQVRPKEGNYMDIRAEMDLLVALSALSRSCGRRQTARRADLRAVKSITPSFRVKE
jgi:uncharacterized protein YcgI (DUF1989 family)